MSNVVIIGSINMDIVANVDHLPAPGETIAGHNLAYFPGGKGANQAIAAAQSGAPTTMVGALGNDTFATTLNDFLHTKKVDTTNISIADTSSGTAIINVDSTGENAITIIPGANATLTPETVISLVFDPTDIIVCQLEIPVETIIACFKQARAQGAQTILNPAPMQPLSQQLLELTSMIILNETELSLLSKVDITHNSTIEEIVEAASTLPQQGFTGLCIVTLGERGCITYDCSTKEYTSYKAYPTDAIDTTGAGDCFVGVFASSLMNGENIEHCVYNAICASSLCVETNGAGPSMPTADQINERYDLYTQLLSDGTRI